MERGYASAAALPLRPGEEILGTLMIYLAKPGGFDKEANELLVNLADNLAYCIQALRSQVILTLEKEAYEIIASDAPLTEQLDSVNHLIEQHSPACSARYSCWMRQANTYMPVP